MVAGYAIGGGHVLHVVCDLTIAADNARFGQTGPRVGSFDGGFGAALLASQVGQKKAKEIWFLCRQYDAQQALEMGLVNTVVPLDELEEETVRWCREMLRAVAVRAAAAEGELQRGRGRPRGPPAARARRQPPLLHDRGGPGGPRRLPGEARARLLEVSAPALSAVAMSSRRQARRVGPAAHLGDGGAAADAAGRDRAGAGRHGAGRQRGRVPPARVRAPRWSAASSSRSGRTSPTTTPTPAAAPTPRSASGRCA